MFTNSFSKLGLGLMRAALVGVSSTLLATGALAQEAEDAEANDTPSGAEEASDATPAPPPDVPATAPPPPSTMMSQATPLAPPPPPEDELPIPTLTIDRVPPNTSYEFAVQVSYGSVAFFRDSVPPWVGFGFRGGWGKNLGLHRLGVDGVFVAEGDIGVHTLLALEPQAAWNYVSNGGLLLGAGVGPAFTWRSRNTSVIPETGAGVVPGVAARIGWSQTWSRVGRRLFLFVEPKVRFAEGDFHPIVAVAVGSGGGR